MYCFPHSVRVKISFIEFGASYLSIINDSTSFPISLKSAIEGLNGKELKGRNLNVNEARPRSESRREGGRGGGGYRY